MAHSPAAADEAPEFGQHSGASHAGLLKLSLGSLGVVFGDIGTSPLYAFREATAAALGEDGLPDRATILGVLSLILWALTLIVSIKYVLILLRADNHGEGGTLSLMALAQRGMKQRSRWVLLLGMMGAALFFADATITPAISVLSAVEGLKVVNPGFQAFVLPLTLVIILALFAVQRTGTGRVSFFFGPITLLWFVVLGVSGVVRHRQRSDGAGGREPALRHRLPRQPRLHRPADAGRRVPGGDRLRGRLYRSRPFRPPADNASPGSAWSSRPWR